MKSLPVLCLPAVVFTLANVATCQEPGVHPPEVTAGNVQLIAIGVSATQKESISDLEHAARDAVEVAGLFKSRGLTEASVTLLCDGAVGALLPTRENICKQIERRAKGMEPGQTLVLFYSGHGVIHDGEWCLIPQDADPAKPKETYISLREVRQFLEDSEASRKLLLLDCCRNEAGKWLHAADARISFSKSFDGATGTELLAACKPGQKSYEWSKNGHGYFTYALLEGLKGGADRAPADRIIDSAELAQFVSDTVPRLAEREHLEQTPVRDLVGTGPFPLLKVPVTAAATDAGNPSLNGGSLTSSANAENSTTPAPAHAIAVQSPTNSPNVVYILFAMGMLCGFIWWAWPRPRKGVTVAGNGRQRHSVP
jgi:hypothetical protein